MAAVNLNVEILQIPIPIASEVNSEPKSEPIPETDSDAGSKSLDPRLDWWLRPDHLTNKRITLFYHHLLPRLRAAFQHLLLRNLIWPSPASASISTFPCK